MREIKAGQSLPIAGAYKRTGRMNFATRQIHLRFPIWARHTTLYSISEDATLTAWWVRVVQISLERGFRSAPALVLRIMWGDSPILQKAKAYSPKPLNCDDCR